MLREIRTLAKIMPQINVTELAILLEVGRTPAARITDIAEALDIKLQTAHFHCHRLALGFADRSGLDLISIKTCQQDKRARRLALTSTGKNIMRALGITNDKNRCDKTVDFVDQQS